MIKRVPEAHARRERGARAPGRGRRRKDQEVRARG